MIKYSDAQITDAVPAELARQPWAQALAFAELQLRKQILTYTNESQINTALDTCPEIILDALAICWKVDWYDTAYPVATKRKVIKNALQIRRYMGTRWATEVAIRNIWPDSDIIEWFDYDGEPGHFRVISNNPEIQEEQLEELVSLLNKVKRCSAHFDGIYIPFEGDAKMNFGWALHDTTIAQYRIGAAPNVG